MDPYRGSLSHFRMHLLVPALFERQNVSGVLRVARGATRREFHIEQGQIVGQSSTVPEEHLGQRLARRGLLSLPAAAEAFELAQSTGRPFGLYLLETGRLNKAALEHALREKAREAFFDCYRWEVGELEFTESPVAKGGIELKINLGNLHRDALGQQREWRTFLTLFPDMDERFRGDASRLGGFESQHPDDVLLVSLAGSGLRLTELLRSGTDSPLDTAKRLVALYRKGAIVPLKRKPAGAADDENDSSSRLALLLGEAEEALSSGNFEQACQLAARALDHGPVHEAHTLWQIAEQRLIDALGDELQKLDGPARVETMPNPLPHQLTVADIVMYGRLRAGNAVRDVVRLAPMGTSAACRSLWRLMQTGVVSLSEAPRASA